jgi:hypothetical protein
MTAKMFSAWDGLHTLHHTGRYLPQNQHGPWSAARTRALLYGAAVCCLLVAMVGLSSCTGSAGYGSSPGTPPPVPIKSVSVSPLSASLRTGGTQQF